MISDMKPYPAYKNSGADWLGKVPDQWILRRMKILFSEIDERGHPTEPLLAATQTKGVVKKEEYNQRTVLALQNLESLKLAVVNDYVISLRSFQGGIERVYQRGIISPAYTVIRLNNADKTNINYYAKLFKTSYYIQNLKLFVTGIRQGQNIDYTKLSRTLLPVPPLVDQRAIVRFLNWADRRIKLIIAARKRRIQLLEEYRQVLINDAVTGKFDVRTGKPYPAYKDSGVEWLSKVPEGWEVVRLKRVARLAYGDSLPADTRSDGHVPVFGSNGPVGYHNQANTLGPVIIVGRKGSFGKVQYSTKPVFAIDTTFYIDKRYANADLRWLYYLLTRLGLDSNSKDSAVPGLDREDAYARLVFLPPLPEQRAIAEYLDRETQKIDAAIEKTKKSIALWEELRTTLIADVVTGKYDVRELAESLPEEEPELEAKIGALEASLQGGETEAVEGVVEEAETVEETA